MGNAFVKLHISVFLAGFTGIFGKLILLPEGPLVWYRMMLTAVLFFIYLLCVNKVPRIPLIEVAKICGVGALISLHWLFFYGSIKYANVSIAVVCFALAGFFTAVFEPLFSRRKPLLLELFFSLLVVVGIALIFHFDTRYRTGIVLGVISAAFAALFTIALKKVGRNHSSSTMLLYQMVGGVLFLSLAAPGYFYLFPQASYLPSMHDWFYLFLLASLCTVCMFLLQIQALRSMSAFTVNLSFNLEPVYSIILAIMLFNEASDLTVYFFVGLSLICLSVLLQNIYAIKHREAQ